MSNRDLFIPSGKRRQPIRPLTGGIRRDTPPQGIPMGSFYDIQNGYVTQYGVRRRPATARFGDWDVDYPPIQGIWTVRAVTGDSYTVLMDQKRLYKITRSGITILSWTEYSTGTCENTSTAVTGSGTAWNTAANLINTGDEFWFENESSTAGAGSTTTTIELNASTNDEATTGWYVVCNSEEKKIASYDSTTKIATLYGRWGTTPSSGDAYKLYEIGEISTITNDTTLTLTNAPSKNYAASTNYVIRRALGSTVDDNTVKNAVIAVPVNVNDKLYIADGSRFLIYTDGTDVDTLNSSYTWKPFSVTYFKDRLWCGHIDDGTNNYRQQIRWSDLGVGNLDTWDTANYLNLPYSYGRINRLMGMSDFLVAYFTDGIWIGQETNLRDLPLAFEKFETGGLGLANPHAVTPWFDGHFFVAQDNVYYLSPKGIEPVGNAVVKDTVEKCGAPLQIMAATDYSTSSIIIGFPLGESDDISEIWRFNYKSKSWSREERTTNFIGTDTVLETVTWDSLSSDLPQDTWDGDSTWAYYPSWDQIVTDEAWNQQLFFNVSSKLYYYQDDVGTVDADGTIPQLILETGDMDLDAPDTKKIWTKLSIQLENPLDSGESLSFTVTGSTDKGRSWKSLGTLTFGEDYDEAAITFRLNGVAARFKLEEVNTSTVSPFTVSEIVAHFKVIGNQIQSRTDA